MRALGPTGKLTKLLEEIRKKMRNSTNMKYGQASSPSAPKTQITGYGLSVQVQPMYLPQDMTYCKEP